MEYRTLGQSGIEVSAVSFGAGPIASLMVGGDLQGQRRTVQSALDAGVNWFDTAATYGDGQSEQALGAALQACGTANRVHIATKVRLAPEQLADIPAAVRTSLHDSLQRLEVERVTLLQLHNSVTARRGDLPTSVTVEDVLGAGGVVSALESLRAEGLVTNFGFTGLGDRRSLAELIRSGAFTSAQVPLNLLTPFSADDRWAGSIDVDYEQLADECSRHGLGVIAIRVFAGGALVGQPPSSHTHKTKFFPLDLFRRDQQRAARLRRALPADLTLAEASLRRVLSLPGVTTALLGFASPAQVEQAVEFATQGPLEDAAWERICRAADSASS